MSSVSKNPFEALGDDDEEVLEDGAQPAVKKEVKEVKKAAAPSDGPKVTSTPAPAAAKDATKTQGRPPKRDNDRQGGSGGAGRGPPRRTEGTDDRRERGSRFNAAGKDGGSAPAEGAEGGGGEGAGGEVRELTEQEKADAEARAEAKRKEDAQMSLDEYLKLKEQERVEVEKLELRQAEAIDMKGLKVKATTEGEEVWTVGDDDKGGKGGKTKKSGRKATPFTDVNFTTPPLETSFGGGGAAAGRGRGRGGGGRGAGGRGGGGDRGGDRSGDRGGDRGGDRRGERSGDGAPRGRGGGGERGRGGGGERGRGGGGDRGRGGGEPHRPRPAAEAPAAVTVALTDNAMFPSLG